MWKIILLEGLGMTGKLYGVPAEHVQDDMIYVQQLLNEKKIGLTYQDTGRTKRIGATHRPIYTLIEINPEE